MEHYCKQIGSGESSEKWPYDKSYTQMSELLEMQPDSSGTWSIYRLPEATL